MISTDSRDYTNLYTPAADNIVYNLVIEIVAATVLESPQFRESGRVTRVLRWYNGVACV